MSKHPVLIPAVALALLVPGAPSDAASPAWGIAGREAPSWGVSEWINLPEDRASLDVKDLRGKVVYLYGFQTWCPGCHKYGFPLLAKLMDHYKEADDVAFVAVQTTFEGFKTNDAAGAWKTAKRYALDIPVGHSGDREHGSALMRRYRTGGTPWVVLIDKDGIVNYNDYDITVGRAVFMIDRMRKGIHAPPMD